MLKGLYTAAMGMNVQSKQLDLISNDLANTATTGYKKDSAAVSSFKEVYLERLNDTQNFIPNEGQVGKITYGAKIDEIFTDYTQGSFVETNQETNMAIQGDGFFKVETANGTAYTRDGSFIINQSGHLVTREGYAVMGEEGPIALGEDYFSLGDKLVVKEKGDIYVAGQYVDRLALVSFEDKKVLSKSADNLYTSSGPGEAFKGEVIQNYLEASNAQTVNAMVDMITVSRAYEANQKVIQTMDSVLGKAVNELGRA